VVEDPPRLVGQLVLLARGLTALGLDRRKRSGCAHGQRCIRSPSSVWPSYKCCYTPRKRVGGVGDRAAGRLSPPSRPVRLEELECVGVTAARTTTRTAQSGGFRCRVCGGWTETTQSLFVLS
jgi:hypothetical protein